MNAVEDDEPRLSAEALKALQEFLEEKNRHEEESTVSENWQLSQFWYDKNTISTLSSAVLHNCDDSSKVALISSPSLYPTIKSKVEDTKKEIKVILFEYDKRFAKYDPDFIYYDYNEPLNNIGEFKSFFDIIIVDPPFLSKECLTKNVETIKLLKKENSKIILCTGAVMEELASELLNLKKCSFEPKHKNNLANQFICMTNFGEILEKT